MDCIHRHVVVVAVCLVNIVALLVFLPWDRLANVVRLEDLIFVERERVLNRNILDVVGAILNLADGQVL